MAAPKAFITDTELQVLKMLWKDQPLTARAIATQLYGEATAATIGTVQKLIQRLESKGYICRDRNEYVHRFSASISQQDVAGMELNELANKLTGGLLAPFITHLVQGRRLSRKEKEQIRRLLEE